MELFYKTLSAIIASICFAIIFRSPRRYFLLTVLVGVISSRLYSVLSAHNSQVFSVSLTAFTIGLTSQILARLTLCPSQAFLVPGVIFLAPGVQIFNALEKIRTQTDPDFTIDIYHAIAVSCSVSFAVLLANWIIPTHKEL
jgi:uncharacterized membrane protein YjjB (DUF3815 family)